MELNQTTLRGILAQITSVDEDYIVPKQGNWWNPQEVSKPHTWCAYIIRSNKPRTVPFYKASDDGSVNSAVTLKIATIDLQFVGKQAETIAQSVALWGLRSDVAAQFKTVNGALLNDGMEAISSPFYQDGSNTVVAWNVTIRVMWYHVLDTNQGAFPSIELDGNINTK